MWLRTTLAIFIYHVPIAGVDCPSFPARMDLFDIFLARKVHADVHILPSCVQSSTNGTVDTAVGLHLERGSQGNDDLSYALHMYVFAVRRLGPILIHPVGWARISVMHLFPMPRQGYFPNRDGSAVSEERTSMAPRYRYLVRYHEIMRIPEAQSRVPGASKRQGEHLSSTPTVLSALKHSSLSELSFDFDGRDVIESRACPLHSSKPKNWIGQSG